LTNATETGKFLPNTSKRPKNNRRDRSAGRVTDVVEPGQKTAERTEKSQQGEL